MIGVYFGADAVCVESYPPSHIVPSVGHSSNAIVFVTPAPNTSSGYAVVSVLGSSSASGPMPRMPWYSLPSKNPPLCEVMSTRPSFTLGVPFPSATVSE